MVARKITRNAPSRRATMHDTDIAGKHLPKAAYKILSGMS